MPVKSEEKKIKQEPMNTSYSGILTQHVAIHVVYSHIVTGCSLFLVWCHFICPNHFVDRLDLIGTKVHYLLDLV